MIRQLQSSKWDEACSEKKEFLHSWYVVIITFFSLAFLFLNTSRPWHSFTLLPFVFFLYFKNGLEVASFLKILKYALLFCFGLFVLALLYPADSLKTGPTYLVGPFTFYQKAILSAYPNLVKLFFVSFVSMSSTQAIDYSKVLLYLMVQKKIPLRLGYPMLLAMNSIWLFKTEFERIKINAKLRALPLKDRVFLVFPLLVFAIRHSQRGALSLVTRGLNENKTFYFSYPIARSDRIWLTLFFCLLVGLLLSLAATPILGPRYGFIDPYF